MSEKILDQIKNIAKNGTEAKYEEALQLLQDYLKSNPRDTEASLLAARIECNSPLQFSDRVIYYAESVLAYDPTNAYALLFLALAHFYLIGVIDDKTYERLCHASNTNPDVMAMIEFAKAEYWDSKDPKKYEECLLKSIGYSDKQYKNLTALGNLYLSQGKINEGNKLLEQAKQNVKIVDRAYDPTNIDSFFDWYYKGTEIPKRVREANNTNE